MFHMEQKDYKLETVNLLLKEQNHIREIAKKLGINHMTILRKIKELYKENVIDYNKEGKNKVYFLKKTTESKVYAYISENYNLLMTLKKYPSLRNIIEKIQGNPKIRLAILFGSYSKGNPKKDSDIDIYIESKDLRLKKEIENIDTRLSVKIGEYDKSNLLIKEIEKNHIIIKGVEDYYERNKFFE